MKILALVLTFFSVAAILVCLIFAADMAVAIYKNLKERKKEGESPEDGTFTVPATGYYSVTGYGGSAAEAASQLTKDIEKDLFSNPDTHIAGLSTYVTTTTTKCYAPKKKAKKKTKKKATKKKSKKPKKAKRK